MANVESPSLQRSKGIFKSGSFCKVWTLTSTVRDMDIISSNPPRNIGVQEHPWINIRKFCAVVSGRNNTKLGDLFIISHSGGVHIR